MKVEEHPYYRAPETPRATLMYLDFVYDVKSLKLSDFFYNTSL